MAEDRPKDWNLTISDLMEQLQSGDRKFVDQHEWDWAREYERSLVSDDARIPRKGDVYEALDDLNINYMTAWAAPFTGSGKAILEKDERIWIDSEPMENKPIGTYALPVDYARLEQQMVPKEEREASNYGGFYLFFSTVQLNEDFKLVDTGFSKEKNSP